MTRMNRRCFVTLAAIGTAMPALAAGQIKLRDLYNKDLSFSDLALSLKGQRVDVAGYMAPPLRADANFFVLTKRPMSTCPFCETEAEWPDDILAVYVKRRLEVSPFNRKIIVSGVLELGGATDAATGFVSRVRLVDSVYERA